MKKESEGEGMEKMEGGGEERGERGEGREEENYKKWEK